MRDLPAWDSSRDLRCSFRIIRASSIFSTVYILSSQKLKLVSSLDKDRDFLTIGDDGQVNKPLIY